ncbi:MULTISPECIES: hypothetical protein [unclassified Photobacterium]|nr:MULTISPECIES: hypothetical protein [unclassified Photobacterium]
MITPIYQSSLSYRQNKRIQQVVFEQAPSFTMSAIATIRGGIPFTI